MDLPEGFVDISPDNDKGVLKKIIKEGSGEARPVSGSTVYVHYVGTLVGGEKDGEKFDSSRDRGEKFSFELGSGQVIKAWDTGIATMRKGEICEFICSPTYAYGDSAAGSIPAKSTLKFEVELFEWKGKDISPNKDGSVMQTVITAGSGWETPKDCAIAKISIKGMLGDIIFDERETEFEIGDFTSKDLVEGIEIAVKIMKKGERSAFTIMPAFAFGSSGSEKFNIPANATVVYEVTLMDFEKIKESYTLENDAERLQYAENFKTKATQKFRAGQFAYAIKLYKKATNYVEHESDFTENKDGRRLMFLSLQSNLALCYLKTDQDNDALLACDKVLELDSKNEKALYRKGQALQLKGDYNEAREVFRCVLEVNPDNRQASLQIQLCDSEIRKHLKAERQLYKSMFSKMTVETSAGDVSNTNGKHEESDA